MEDDAHFLSDSKVCWGSCSVFREMEPKSHGNGNNGHRNLLENKLRVDLNIKNLICPPYSMLSGLIHASKQANI